MAECHSNIVYCYSLLPTQQLTDTQDVSFLGSCDSPSMLGSDDVFPCGVVSFGLVPFRRISGHVLFLPVKDNSTAFYNGYTNLL